MSLTRYYFNGKTKSKLLCTLADNLYLYRLKWRHFPHQLITGASERRPTKKKNGFGTFFTALSHRQRANSINIDLSYVRGKSIGKHISPEDCRRRSAAPANQSLAHSLSEVLLNEYKSEIESTAPFIVRCSSDRRNNGIYVVIALHFGSCWAERLIRRDAAKVNIHVRNISDHMCGADIIGRSASERREAQKATKKKKKRKNSTHRGKLDCINMAKCIPDE